MYLAAMSPPRSTPLLAAFALLLTTPSACRGQQSSRLPAVPEVRGPLAIRVVYPTATDRVDARDSSFLLGSVGDGGATLTVNGAPVPVAPNGAFLAWVRWPDESPARFTLVARRGGDTASTTVLFRRLERFTPR